MKTNNIPIGRVLVNKGFITEEQLEEALLKQRETKGKRLGNVLIELGFVNEADLLKALSERLHTPIVDLDMLEVKQDALNMLPEATARKYTVLPIDVENGMLTVALNDPLDFYLLDNLKIQCNANINTVLAPKKSLETAIDRYYTASKLQNTLGDVRKELSSTHQEDSLATVLSDERVDNSPIVKLVNTIISQAYLARASDIHLEPNLNETIVRFRIDGELIKHMALEVEAHTAIVTRLKIMGNVNIAEKRIPQDGRFHVNFNEGQVDIRLSTLPTIHGEKVVLRLLGGLQQQILSLDQLGLTDHNRALYDEIIKAPTGIILVTGPTGSGKTTTLYSALKALARPQVNVVTIEDPVELPLEGITQVQVNPKAGLTFAMGLRSILRQDPNIIMVGEVRDGETAEIAMRAAITGHQVLTTLHTNDAVSAVLRLVDMGVEPYLVAAALNGVIAQRLVKLNCPDCKEGYSTTAEENVMLGLEQSTTIYRSRGCIHCNDTGYKGRRAIHEILVIDKVVRKKIVEHEPMDQLMAYAMARGTRNLKDNAKALVLQGEINIDEMVRVAYSLDH